jgi:hypothetical protein
MADSGGGVMKKTSRKTWYIFWVAAVLGLFLSMLTVIGYAAAKRGDAPRCQTECLAQHRSNIEKLMNNYEKTQNKVDFQEHVDKAVEEYRECVENCRELMPVK